MCSQSTPVGTRNSCLPLLLGSHGKNEQGVTSRRTTWYKAPDTTSTTNLSALGSVAFCWYLSSVRKEKTSNQGFLGFSDSPLRSGHAPPRCWLPAHQIALVPAAGPSVTVIPGSQEPEGHRHPSPPRADVGTGLGEYQLSLHINRFTHFLFICQFILVAPVLHKNKKNKNKKQTNTLQSWRGLCCRADTTQAEGHRSHKLVASQAVARAQRSPLTPSPPVLQPWEEHTGNSKKLLCFPHKPSTDAWPFQKLFQSAAHVGSIYSPLASFLNHTQYLMHCVWELIKQTTVSWITTTSLQWFEAVSAKLFFQEEWGTSFSSVGSWSLQTEDCFQDFFPITFNFFH